MPLLRLQTLSVLTLLCANLYAQGNSTPRVLSLPLSVDTICNSQQKTAVPPSFLIDAIMATSKFDAPQGLEWDLLANRNNLLQSPTAAQILQASLESQAQYILIPKWVHKDSLCAIKISALRSADLRPLIEWIGEPLKEMPQPAYVSDFTKQFIAQTITATLGKIQIESVPAGATVTGLLSPTVVTPYFLDTLPIKDYPIVISAPGYESYLDTLRPKAQTLLAKRYELKHTQAWTDSVASFQKKAHRDSLINQAEEAKAQELPGLFSRLMSVTLPSNGTPIAVLPFQVQNPAQTKLKLGYDIGAMAAEYGVTYLRKDARVRLVERAQLDVVLQEQALAQTGIVENDSSAIQAGRIAAVRYIVTGSVTVTNDKQVFFAKLVDVESGEIIAAASATVLQQKNEELFRAALGERASAWGAGFRSMVLPGWGQFYTNHTVQGGVFLGAFVLSAGYATFCFLDYQKKQDNLDKFKDLDPSTMSEGESTASWITRANQAVIDRNKSVDRLNIGLALVGTVWAANVIDAFVLGHLDSKAIRGQYFTASPIVLDHHISGLAMNYSF